MLKPKGHTWALVAVLMMIGIVLVGGGLFFLGNYMEKKEAEDHYKKLLKQSERAASHEEQLKLCEEGIYLLPSEGKAYHALLDLCFEDEIFQNEEEVCVRRCLYGNTQGRENISYLKENTLVYGEFCYDLAVGYFFRYERLQGKRISSYWFSEALAHGEYLEEGKKSRAAIYEKLGHYYDFVGVQDKSEETLREDYGDLYEDIALLNEYEPEELGTEVASYTLYMELIFMMEEHSYSFLQSSLSYYDALRFQLGKIEAHVESFPFSEEKRSLLEDNIAEAYKNIDIAYEKNIQEGL